jgi:hypothetical protein
VAPILNIERYISSSSATNAPNLNETSMLSTEQNQASPSDKGAKDSTKTTFIEQGDWSDVTNITTKET